MENLGLQSALDLQNIPAMKNQLRHAFEVIFLSFSTTATLNHNLSSHHSHAQSKNISISPPGEIDYTI